MKKKGGLPLSGSESPYSWAPWGKSLIHKVNCYAYAMGSHERFKNRSVPGNHMGLPPFFSNFRTCKGLEKRVIGDNPGKVYRARAAQKCRKGYYKVMMFFLLCHRVPSTLPQGLKQVPCPLRCFG